MPAQVQKCGFYQPKLVLYDPSPRAAPPPHPAAVFQWLRGGGIPQLRVAAAGEKEEEEEEEGAKDMLRRGFLTRSSAAMIFMVQLEVGGGGISRPPDPTS